MRLVFDIEANGLFDASLIWCLVTTDLDTAEKRKFGPSEVEQGLRHLMSAEVIIGHNVIGYDLWLIKKLYPWFEIPATVYDTLVLSRLVYPNLSDTDTNRKAVCEAKLVGSHSLKAWGIRLGLLKLEHEDWSQFSPEMLERCSVDVDVTERLWSNIQAKNVDPRAIDLEHKVAWICARQERQGFTFDVRKAETLTATLMERRTELEAELQDTFKPFYLPDGPPKKWKRTINRKKPSGVIEYCPEEGEYQPIKLTVFNAGSRQHIAHRLKALYNWVPTEFTDSGQAKIDETVLGKLPWPEAKLLNEYFLVQKRLGMLAEGDNAWLKLVRNGKIHGEVITNGAVTGRATHRNPNVAQTPAVSALYGKDCRELFGPARNKRQVGIDVSGLELRMLAHYLSRWDGGAYGRVVCQGDVHTVNATVLFEAEVAKGLKDERLLIDCANEHPGSGEYLRDLNPGSRKTAKVADFYKTLRNLTKTFIYAFLYGAGDWKIGHTVKPLQPEPQKKTLGKTLKERFTKRTPGLEKLLTAVKQAAKRGFLVGLDGRHLHIRSDHAALNTLLQSAGALICKRWMVEIDLELSRRNWHDKVQQLAWVHDELQFQCDPEVADEFGLLAVECIVRAGQYFDIKVPLTGEYKVGANWAECH